MFSIITIVYNDSNHILQTMQSVLSQTYKNIEYILIDGGSTDGTKEKILDYLKQHTHIIKQEITETRLYLEAKDLKFPKLTFKFLSEKDEGIYDAMNKGIKLATQEWINFMNCGDYFYNAFVLEKLISTPNIQSYDILYGDCEVVYPQFQLKIVKKSPYDLGKSLSSFGDGLIHQSFFFRLSVQQNNLYENKIYTIASDYEMFYRLFTKNYSFLKINFPISIFHTEGTSDIYALKRNKETLSIALRYGKNRYKSYWYFLIAYPKKTIKTHFPSLATILLQRAYK